MNYLRTRRIRFWQFVVLAWVILSVNNLDGVFEDSHGVDAFSVWRAMAAWYVLISGIALLSSIFIRVNHWFRVLAWACFGAGMLFWATAASSGWPLWVCTALGAWFMAYKTARNPVLDECYG